jgi:hypothetical protein
MGRRDYRALDAAILQLCQHPMPHSRIQAHARVRDAARKCVGTTGFWYPLISRRLQALRRQGKLTNNMVSGDGCEWYPPRASTFTGDSQGCVTGANADAARALHKEKT